MMVRFEQVNSPGSLWIDVNRITSVAECIYDQNTKSWGCGDLKVLVIRFGHEHFVAVLDTDDNRLKLGIH